MRVCCAALTVACGRHAEATRGAFVGAAAGTVAGGVHGIRGGWSVFELLFEPAKAAGIGVGAGRDAEGALENALQVKRAQADLVAQRGEAERFFEIGFNQLADTRDHCGVRGNFARVTAAAGAEAILLGGVAGGEEGDLMARGSAGGAGGSAVNAGGPHRKDKLSVGICLAALHSLPALVVEFDSFHLPTRYAGI
jgi:hypothetical protein